MYTLTLTSSHFADFHRLCEDTNSIHHSVEGARASGFSQAVFYGMGAVWLSLANWAGGRRFALQRLRVRFHRPLYAERPYSVSTQAEGSEVKIYWKRGGKIQLALSFRYEWLDGSSVPSLAMEQARFLFWASHYCGTVVPGDGSILLSLNAEFGAAVDALRVEERDGLWLLSGSQSGVREFEIQSLKPRILSPTRPAPSPRGKWQDQKLVVTGGSRGLGQALSARLQASGAQVYTVSQSTCDLGCVEATRRWVQTLPVQLDGLILNAVPMIEKAEFLELGIEEWMRFVDKGLRITLNVTEQLLPRLRPGSFVQLISSEFVSAPTVQLSHYVALKSALEGWLRTLALEHPQIKFSTPQLPPFSSRQNGLSRKPLPSAQAVAELVVRNLGNGL